MTQTFCALVVDDNPADLELARIAFEEHAEWAGITTRESGEAALAYLRDPAFDLPDVVILDLNMPVMTGFDVLRLIRSDPALAHLPVVILTTSPYHVDVARADALQADSYLIKPPTMPEFYAQIATFLAQWREVRPTRRPGSRPA